MVSFRVRASSLSEVAALLGTVIATFDTNVSTVDGHVNRTVGSTWVGEDADKFEEDWTTFLVATAAVRQSLTALQNGLIAADGSYTQNESGVQRSFTGRIGSVQGVRKAAGAVGRRVDTGEERAELIEEFFDEQEEERAAALVGGTGVRAAGGQQNGSAPEDEDEDPNAEGEPVTFEQVEADVEAAGASVDAVDAQVDAGGVEAQDLSSGLDDLAEQVWKVK